MNSRVTVSAIIRKGNKYLFGRRLKNIFPYANTWMILGGGVHLDDEKLEEGLRREIKEEAGIEITNIKRFSFDEDWEKNKKEELTHYLFLVFTADYKSGKEKAGDDIKELRWFSKEELKKVPLSRPTIKLFKERNFYSS